MTMKIKIFLKDDKKILLIPNFDSYSLRVY